MERADRPLQPSDELERRSLPALVELVRRHISRNDAHQRMLHGGNPRYLCRFIPRSP